MMDREAFKSTLTRLHNEYDVRFIVGDFNARHPRWCHDHHNPRRGKEMIKFIRTFPEYTIYASKAPTFEAIECRVDSTKRTSTVDLVLRKKEVNNLHRVDGYIATCSDHYPI